MSIKITLYARQGCHLCEDAKAVLIKLQHTLENGQNSNFWLEEIDIANSDELTEQYGLMIPVVEINGEVVAYGFVHEFDIKNRLYETLSNYNS